MRADHKEAIAARVYETFRAVTIGVFVTAAAQGFAATVGFWISDVRLPMLLGLATGMASLLGASFVITVPVALFVMSQSKAWGIFLLIWGMVVVGMLDNFLKPILIGSKARMPFFLIFFSIICGLKLYGPMGFLLGPILVASFLTFVKIYREEYLT
jgi:predicted PurR-regulated permease PerM